MLGIYRADNSIASLIREPQLKDSIEYNGENTLVVQTKSDF